MTRAWRFAIVDACPIVSNPAWCRMFTSTEAITKHSLWTVGLHTYHLGLSTSHTTPLGLARSVGAYVAKQKSVRFQC